MAKRDVRLGESIGLLTPRGTKIEAEALESCGESVGHWMCAAHPDVPISNNLGMHGHTESAGQHVEVWVCHEHGPEVP